MTNGGKGGRWDELQSFKKWYLILQTPESKNGVEKSDENKLATLPATVTLPPGLWEGTEEEFRARLEAAAGWVNQHHDVDGLCKEMPRRMHDAGDRTESKELMS